MQATTGTPLSDVASGPPAHRRPRRHLGLWAAVATVAYLLDQVTKWWAQNHLTTGEPRQVAGHWLELDLTHNGGAAFSVGTSYTIVLTVVAIAVVLVSLRFASRLGSRGWAVALGLLLGGALGNVTDRVFRSPGPLRGHVVDFVQLPHWPVFNLADASICVSAVLFVLLSLYGVRLDGSRDTRGRGAAAP
ncbi:MAG: signal peptidase [Nocardioidaceae bacterium]|jgi:signal peptidase II|nr:signal peptidase [Nocardioidaceae bacterium]MDX6308230.1 signal peptidase [Nocardioidaceae bacterium]